MRRIDAAILPRATRGQRCVVRPSTQGRRLHHQILGPDTSGLERRPRLCRACDALMSSIILQLSRRTTELEVFAALASLARILRRSSIPLLGP